MRFVPWLLVVIAASMAIGYAWVGWNIMQSQPDFSEDYATSTAVQKEIPLPDGSLMQLQGTATVSYSPKVRKVTLLSGQATFTVAEGTVPFDVVAGKARIIANGKRFFVNNHRTGKAFEAVDVVAVEGNVYVMRDSIWLWQTKTLLQPGQTVQIDGQANIGNVSGPTQ